MKHLLIIIALFFSCFAADPWSGKCVGVSDGDTISVMNGTTSVKIRIHGVDCPEAHQDFGNKAKQFTSSLCFGEAVTVTPSDTDRYGRTVGKVTVGEKDVGTELLKAGLAWHYIQYDKSPEYAAAEATAKERKFGLWSMPNPVPPWNFRRSGGDLKPTSSDVYVTKSGSKYHVSGCRYLSKNAIPIALAAARDGYSPCSACIEQAVESRKVQAVTKEATVKPGDQPAVDGGRCQATTKKGEQCKRAAEPGRSYCWQH
jgi:endonuclease YncB( thermonuclease family)